MEFPIYRKYNGIDVWFKVVSATEFFEYKKMGNKLVTDKITAKIFPEHQFVRDLIACYEGRWVEVSENNLNDFLLSFI